VKASREEVTRSRLLKRRMSRMNIGWTDAAPLVPCAHARVSVVHPAGSLPGHVKGCLKENRLSTFQPTAAKPTGVGRSSRKAVR